MEYLVTFIAPIVRQRSAHQCFVLSRGRSNENIVWLSSDDLKKNMSQGGWSVPSEENNCHSDFLKGIHL